MLGVMLVARFVSLLLPVWLGCGVEIGDPMVESSSDGKDDSGSGALTVREFFAEVGEQYCDECFRCQATYPNGPVAFVQDFGTKPQCYAEADAFYMPALVEQSIAAGRVVYDQAAADECADGIRYESDCREFWNEQPRVPNSCNTVFVGTVPDGGVCVTGYDCANPAARCDDATKRCMR